MMITSTTSREKDLQGKQEVETNDDNSKFPKPSTSKWSAFRNPRIVRVSRSFGGKDRHSKVCTVRGLRDRRIRLSVPTAIQLYDLQDRLGLSQPSKVIDWLIDNTKDDIDKLPPLQMPQGFGQFHHPHQSIHSSLSPLFDHVSSNGGFHSLGITIGGGGLDRDHQEEQNTILGKSLKQWGEVEDSSISLRGKSKEVQETLISEKGKWIRSSNNEQENQGGGFSSLYSSSNTGQVQAQKLFPLASSQSPSIPGLLNNSIPFNSFYQWDASNLSLSHQLGSHGFLSNQADTNANCSLPSSLALSTGSQLFFCPQAAMGPPLFPPYPPYIATTTAITTPPLENHDHHQSREINHLHLLSSSSQHHHVLAAAAPSTSSSIRPFSLNVNAGLLHLQTGHSGSHNGHQKDNTINNS